MTGLVSDSAEHQLIRESVTKIAAKYGPDYYLDLARSGGKPEELWHELGGTGLLGAHIPEEFGGGGAGLTELVVVIEELAANGIPMLLPIISSAICACIIKTHSAQDQKEEWLPGLASGQRRMAFGLTEPNSGSNSHNVSTTARRNEGGWTITGSKYYISAADEAEAILVVARDAEIAADIRPRLSLFIVPTDAPGLVLQPLDTVLTSTDKQFTVFMDNVQVADNAIIGTPGDGLRQVFSGLNPERITAAALSSGIGRYAISKAQRYAQERQVWTRPIGAHQGVSHPLAEAHIAVELARLATYRSAALIDSDQEAGESANIAKFAAAEASLKALDQSIQVHGGNGFSKEYGLAELWFTARLMRTAPVSREMVLNFVAQTSLGLPRSY
ncbi:acyl-CoA dehydrogenase family protein [Rhodococcus sp. MSC1_016]|uniref:acyl-CoA dehydrogenase family protein n=1 Tax=Rhodococcus sp. MSC1_016 TaxID=2909266 RepID=UPI00202E9B13|nr:acyl-CoA dehydrogenase family protein [Rhodococcus sp. MSC1_016]